ncbi:unnamed protein product [Albugo candida]|uniref:Uncharacterized protein n=1 Tax=Albugo candida TaxID=65357 RepID=A0A024GD95_9STRA|nr:unnamed protein product [Albugo candida]|eukprot:CCI44303.1 unnamed protein product [Albugo candida]
MSLRAIRHFSKVVLTVFVIQITLTTKPTYVVKKREKRHIDRPSKFAGYSAQEQRRLFPHVIAIWILALHPYSGNHSNSTGHHDDIIRTN